MRTSPFGTSVTPRRRRPQPAARITAWVTAHALDAAATERITPQRRCNRAAERKTLCAGARHHSSAAALPIIADAAVTADAGGKPAAALELVRLRKHVGYLW